MNENAGKGPAMEIGPEQAPSNYLVVHQRAAQDQELINALGAIEAGDSAAQFTLLVPASPVRRGLTWTEGESAAAAWRKASLARAAIEQAGMRVASAIIGDASPAQAVADVLIRDDRYKAIVMATSPAGVSGWVGLDLRARVRRRFGLPVISVSMPLERNRVDGAAPNNVPSAASTR